MLLLERGTVAGSPAYFLCERGEITHPYLSRDIAVKNKSLPLSLVLNTCTSTFCHTIKFLSSYTKTTISFERLISPPNSD
jgi:hypothetical protein